VKQFDFYFPDNKDFVDPEFNGITNTRTKHYRQYDDGAYPHEILNKKAYDGMLVSLAAVGTMQKKGKYYEQELTEDFYFGGAREFLRLNKPQHQDIKLMGDCGAFDYVAEFEPPFSINELIEFYERGKFDYGISLDHIVFPYAKDDEALAKLPHTDIAESERRIAITLNNAKEFYERSQTCSFEAYGVAHGYSVDSFVRSVKELEAIGYRRITIGGMIKSKTPDLLALLEVLSREKHPDTQFHLLGICRFENIDSYIKFGVTSADSTSPLMQGIKGGKYYDLNHITSKVEESLSARIRQCDHTNVQNLIESSRQLMKAVLVQMSADDEFDIDLSNTALSMNECVKRLEVDCIEKLIAYESGSLDFEHAFKAFKAYEKITNPKYLNPLLSQVEKNKLAREMEHYKTFLKDKLWMHCSCGICDKGVMNIIFRSNQTNRRRGIHNLSVITEFKTIMLKQVNDNEGCN